MLTDSKLKVLKAKGRLYKVVDRDGLYVAVLPSGTVSLRYDSSINGRRETLALGKYDQITLIYGAEKSSNPEKNLRVVEGFTARLEVLSYGNDVAVHTGQVRAELARVGTSVGPYDCMIAAHARSQGFILGTNNTREFVRINGLRLEDWSLY